MALIEFIKSLINTIFNWLLGNFNKNTEHKRQQAVKFKRLLFSLLELRRLVNMEISIDRQFGKLLIIYENEIRVVSMEVADYLKDNRSWFAHQIKQGILPADMFSEARLNTVTALKEVSEMDPLFAFRLSAIYIIVEKVDSIKDYLKQFSQANGAFNQPGETVFESTIRPRMLVDISFQLNHYVLEVAKMIDNKTYEETQCINRDVAIVIDEAEVKQFLEPFIARISEVVND